MNNLIKKGLVIGIICLLMFASGPTVVSEEGLPDFKIVDVKIDYNIRNGWPYIIVYIENRGSDVSWNGKCRFTIKRLFKNSKMYVRTQGWDGNKTHNSGTIKSLYMGTFIEIYGNTLPAIFFARIFFEVDPNNKVNESNEGNNVVWTYMFGAWFALGYLHLYGLFLLGRLRQQ